MFESGGHVGGRHLSRGRQPQGYGRNQLCRAYGKRRGTIREAGDPYEDIRRVTGGEWPGHCDLSLAVRT